MVPLVYSVGSKQVNAETWAVNGSWSFDASLGPQQGGGVPGSGLVRLTDGAVATFAPKQALDHVNTYCATDSGTGSLSVLIDGVAAGSACAQQTSSVQAHAVISPAVRLGEHQVTFTYTGSCLLYAAEGTAGNSGVSVHNIAVGSAAAEWFGAPEKGELAFTDLIPGGTQIAITDLLTNDPGVGYSVESYGRAMANLLAHEGASGAEVLAVVLPVSRIVGIAHFPEYTSALLTVAAGVPVVNIQSSWGTSFDANSGYWSNDQIHPNTVGSLAEYQLIRQGMVLP